MNESQINSCQVLISKIFSDITILFTPIFCVVEMIILPWNLVLLGKAMYQSAFLSLEFPLNLEVVSSVTKHKFTKFVKNSCLTLI